MNRFREYINGYFYCSLGFVAVAIVGVVLGYGYSTIAGVIHVGNKRAYLQLFGGLAILFLLFDILYVHLKRRYKKKGLYKDEE
jgi:hypothetical protein